MDPTFKSPPSPSHTGPTIAPKSPPSPLPELISAAATGKKYRNRKLERNWRADYFQQKAAVWEEGQHLWSHGTALSTPWSFPRHRQPPEGRRNIMTSVFWCILAITNGSLQFWLLFFSVHPVIIHPSRKKLLCFKRFPMDSSQDELSLLFKGRFASRYTRMDRHSRNFSVRSWRDPVDYYHRHFHCVLKLQGEHASPQRWHWIWLSSQRSCIVLFHSFTWASSVSAGLIYCYI